MSEELEVLYRDARWIAVRKPPGMTTTPGDAGVSLLDHVRDLVGTTEALHPLSRLDYDVTGVALFALDYEATRIGSDAKARGAYVREYHALVSPPPAVDHADYRWPIGIDPRNPSRRVAAGGREREDAHSAMRVRERRGAVAWLELTPYTGRTHQLRVHCAKAGHPVLGDKTYRGRARVTLVDGEVLAVPRAMLHLGRVSVAGAVVVECPVSSDYSNVWAACSRAT